MFSQDRHEALLREVLLNEYNTSVEMGTELESFVQTSDDVEVRLIKHTAEGKQTESESARFEFVIGTDGARSAVRKQLGLSFLGESRTEHVAVTGDLELKNGIPDKEVGILYFCARLSYDNAQITISFIQYWYSWGGGATPL